MRHWLPAVALLALPALALAQDAPTPPPLVTGTVDFSFVATTGNSSTQSIGLSGDTFYRPPSWEVRNKVSYVRAKAGGELSAQAITYLGRVARKLTPRLSGFGQYDYTRDRFAGIQNRNGVMGGVALLVTETAPHALTVFGSLGYVNEQRLAGADISTGAADAGWAYKLKVSPTAEFTDDFRWGASFYDTADWRIGHIAAFTTQINGLFALKASHTTRYVNFPPPGFKSTDTTTAIALVAKF